MRLLTCFGDCQLITQLHSLAVSLSILANAIGSLTWAAYSGFCTSGSSIIFTISDRFVPIDGRKSVILWSMGILSVGSLGAGAARTVPRTAHLAHHSSVRCIERTVGGHRCPRRHLQAGGTGPGFRRLLRGQRTVFLPRN